MFVKDNWIHWLTCFTLREDVFHHLVTICSHIISYLLLITYLLLLRPPAIGRDLMPFVDAYICDNQAKAFQLNVNFLYSVIKTVSTSLIWIFLIIHFLITNVGFS